MFHSFHNCCQSFLFSHRHKLGLKRQMKKKMQKCKIFVTKKQKRLRPVYESTHMKKDGKNDRVAYFESVSFQLMLR